MKLHNFYLQCLCYDYDHSAPLTVSSYVYILVILVLCLASGQFACSENNSFTRHCTGQQNSNYITADYIVQCPPCSEHSIWN